MFELCYTFSRCLEKFESDYTLYDFAFLIPVMDFQCAYLVW
jgi:hypothetical protein